MAVASGCASQSGWLSISFDLTTRVATGNRLAILLHLFRNGVCILTKRICLVDERDAVLVLARCSDSLERRGYFRFTDDEFGHSHMARRAA